MFPTQTNINFQDPMSLGPVSNVTSVKSGMEEGHFSCLSSKNEVFLGGFLTCKLEFLEKLPKPKKLKWDSSKECYRAEVL